MNLLIETAASLTECLIVVRLCNRFLGFKNRKHAWLKSAVFLALLMSDNLPEQTDAMKQIAVFALFGVIFLYVLLFLDGTIQEKVLISLFPPITILPINMIILTSFRVFSGCSAEEITKPGGNLRIPVLLFSKIAFFFACEFLLHMRNRGRYSLSRLQWTIQFSCFAITFLIANSLRKLFADSDEMPLFLFISIMIAILNLLFYMIMDKMQYDNSLKEEYRISRITLAAQERFVDEAKERYMEMRTLRHDMRGYFMTAAELISSRKTEEAIAYIEKIINEKIDFAPSAVNTGNVVIDAVLNNKIAVCQKNGIEIKCVIDSCPKNISDMDISILLSNLLDNAINGSSGSVSPAVELVMGTRKTLTFMTVKNTIAASVLKKNPRLETDKENKSVHGFGIKSIQKIAEKYNGTVEFREEHDIFTAEICLEAPKECCRL